MADIVKNVYDLNLFYINFVCKAGSQLWIFNSSYLKAVYFVSFFMGGTRFQLQLVWRETRWRTWYSYLCQRHHYGSLCCLPARPFPLSFNYNCQIRHCLHDTIFFVPENPKYFELLLFSQDSRFLVLSTTRNVRRFLLSQCIICAHPCCDFLCFLGPFLDIHRLRGSQSEPLNCIGNIWYVFIIISS